MKMSVLFTENFCIIRNLEEKSAYGGKLRFLSIENRPSVDLLKTVAT